MTDFETYFEMFIAEDGEDNYTKWFAQQTEDDLIRIEREIEVAKEYLQKCIRDYKIKQIPIYTKSEK